MAMFAHAAGMGALFTILEFRLRMVDCRSIVRAATPRTTG
jgi:hypothetical protein